MLSFIWKEKNYTSGGTLLKETQTTYYSTTGKFGAIDLIKRWKTGSTYLNWDYSYSSTNPNLITITVDLPGSAGTETYEYRYGVLSKIERPGYTELSRTISQHDSSILSETNQHGGVMNFTYDGLGRITNIDMPSGFNDVGASWATNSVTITQGTNTVVKYWDGLGRDTGYEESGDGITLYSRKTLDAEGRLIAESKGSTDSTDTYSYELSAMGQVKKITDPRGKITNISYSGDVKTVTDPEGRVTAHEYAGLPGLVTKLTDAQSRISNHTYDAIGRLAQAVYNSARTQSYTYDGLDNITSETHPETGTISYTYSSENNLSLKSWGGTQLNYTYNSSNQLTTLNAADETITYEYDTNGRIKKVSSTKSWNRDLITYNSLGSVTGETQNIPGLTSKATSYAYDGNNNLRELTYPDGKKVTYTNNGLNMPETATFDSQGIVSAVSYGYGKQSTSITISGNGTSFSASYNEAGALSLASLAKGATTLYAATYSYDGLGNITSISNTTPQLNGTFGYDSLYRLTSAGYTPSGVGRVNNFTYTYDEYGNMTTVKEDATMVFNKTYNSQNQISGFSYDSRGNLTADGNFQYIWDNQNRLQELKSASGDPIESYLYNERALRLKAVGGEAPFSIFTFDGKLLSQFQYSPTGLQIRSYIYLGDRLIAEYRQGGNQIYFYTPDQVNSVRLIIAWDGILQYSVTYDPYGGIQKQWSWNYSPLLKFGGKERDQESGMDYFGARYYNHTQYRFNSSDPLIAREDAISNPQLWNLYAFCRNNPVSLLDPDGSLETSLTKVPINFDKWQMFSYAKFSLKGGPGVDECVDAERSDGKYSPRFKYHAEIEITMNKDKDNLEILKHEQRHVEGFEWLYYRNVELFKQAEMLKFGSRAEALKFGQELFVKTINWRPFKWQLYSGLFNPLSWFLHKSKWDQWATNKDWK